MRGVRRVGQGVCVCEGGHGIGQVWCGRVVRVWGACRRVGERADMFARYLGNFGWVESPFQPCKMESQAEKQSKSHSRRADMVVGDGWAAGPTLFQSHMARQLQAPF